MTRLVGSAFTGWLLLSSLVLMLGAVVTRTVLGPRTGLRREVRVWAYGVSARVGAGAAAGLMVALGFYFIRQLAEFRDPFVAWTEDATLLLGTGWGRVWTAATVTSLLALVGFVGGRDGRRWAWTLAGVSVLGLTAFPALTGHASAAEHRPLLVFAADIVHVGAAGGWLGGLALVVMLSAAWRRREREPGTILPQLVRAFHPVAIACVGTLILTGAVAAYSHLPELSALWGSTYGRTLLVKVALAGIAFGLGGLNWRRHRTGIDTVGTERGLTRAAFVEILVGQLVLLVTAVLIRTPPGG